MSSNPPRPLLLQEVQLLQISDDSLRINDTAQRSCFNNQSGKADSSFVPYDRTHHFSYSHTDNKFIAIGCDIFAYITEHNSTTYETGCASLCPDNNITVGFLLLLALALVAAGLISKRILHGFICGFAASTCSHQPGTMNHVALLSLRRGTSP
ncbi:hypothetical protein AAG906_004850 [Vitis piasezkii]